MLNIFFSLSNLEICLAFSTKQVMDVSVNINAYDKKEKHGQMTYPFSYIK